MGYYINVKLGSLTMTVQVKNEVKGHDMCKFVRPPRFGLKVGWGFQTIFFLVQAILVLRSMLIPNIIFIFGFTPQNPLRHGVSKFRNPMGIQKIKMFKSLHMGV